jgi:hypothetical protein
VPLIAAVLVLFAVLALAVILLPISLIQRYRLGTRRRAARGWLITLNLAGVTISAAMFILSAAVMSRWIPGAFTYSAGGLLTGCAIGVLGLALTRWEPAPGGLHYTPSRLLILGLTFVIVARLGYGLWRSWHAWTAAADAASWLAESGARGSLAAGAVVLGYYIVYWWGVRRRLARAARVRRVTGRVRS